MKRFLCVAVIIFMLPVRAQCISTQASSAVLMDMDSGRVLYEKDMHQPRLIASTTKLMTALVAVESGLKPEETAIVQPDWVGAEGSSIYLKAGERVSFKELLYGMLLHSGNDAAMAIACWIAGSEAEFSVFMNAKAKELGMVNSSFANASGLNQEGHFSTAYDMALLARACLRNPVVAEVCATRSATVGSRTFINHNKLLQRYEGCVGLKTGYTERAGRTLVSAAKREGQTLICVTLNDSDDWNDHEALYDYGFKTYPQTVLCQANAVLGTVPVVGSLITFVPFGSSCGVSYPLKDGESPSPLFELCPAVEAPVTCSTVVGRISWQLNGEKIAQTELICLSGAGRDLFCPLSLRERWNHIFGD